MEKKRNVRSYNSNSFSYNPDDGISRLSDDILLLILSSLPFKEATATSLLSRRWRCFSAYLPRLDFDASIILANSIPKFVKHVRKVLRLYRGHNMEEFRLRHSLRKQHTRFIDLCVEFALSKNVQRLDLDFSFTLRRMSNRAQRYAFQIGELNHVTGFMSLRSICLTFVKMGGDVLDGLLLNCTALEMLALHDVSSLSYVKVLGPSLRLKHLAMFNCPDLKEIEIHDVPLVSLKGWLCGDNAVRMSKVPHLVELSVTCLKPFKDFELFSYCFSQLESLELFVFLVDKPPVSDVLSLVSRLTKLSELKLKYNLPKDLPLLAPLLEALPHLQKITIQVICTSSADKEHIISREVRVGVLENLKLLEFTGYSGEPLEDEFISSVTMNAAGLETIIIIHPHFQNQLDSPRVDEVRVGQEYAKRSAKERLEGIIPRRIKLVIG
ncbi:F-box/FBD/LRR-repeat protein At5g56420 [Linum perenne]